MAFKFEKLKVWKNAVDLSGDKFRKFLGYALRSGIEVVGCLFLVKRRKLINNEAFNIFYDKLTILIKGIQALRNSIK